MTIFTLYFPKQFLKVLPKFYAAILHWNSSRQKDYIHFPSNQFSCLIIPFYINKLFFCSEVPQFCLPWWNVISWKMGWGYSSVVEHFPSICKVLGSILRMAPKQSSIISFFSTRNRTPNSGPCACQGGLYHWVVYLAPESLSRGGHDWSSYIDIFYWN